MNFVISLELRFQILQSVKCSDSELWHHSKVQILTFFTSSKQRVVFFSVVFKAQILNIFHQSKVHIHNFCHLSKTQILTFSLVKSKILNILVCQKFRFWIFLLIKSSGSEFFHHSKVQILTFFNILKPRFWFIFSQKLSWSYYSDFFHQSKSQFSTFFIWQKFRFLIFPSIESSDFDIFHQSEAQILNFLSVTSSVFEYFFNSKAQILKTSQSKCFSFS